MKSTILGIYYKECLIYDTIILTEKYKKFNEEGGKIA